MLESLKEGLKKTLDRTSGTVGLFLSGGSDSLLLLRVLLDIKANFSVVCFDQHFTREQRKQVEKWITELGVRVFTYAPSNAYLVGDGKKVSVIEEYKFLDGVDFPFIRDAVHADGRCSIEDVKFGEFLYGPAPIGFTLNLFGTRKTDRHYITGKAWPSAYFANGRFSYYSPLWEWTRKDVKAALKHYGESIPKLDTGSIPMCLNCLCGKGKVFCPKKNTEIDAHDWDPLAMTAAFREKYAR